MKGALAQGQPGVRELHALSWLPNFLQSQHHIAIFSSGVYAAIIYGTALLLTVGLIATQRTLVAPKPEIAAATAPAKRAPPVGRN